MMCQSINSDQEEKEGDVLNGNHIVNLKNFITNIDNVLVSKECAQESEIQIKLEEEIDVENFIEYIEANFQLKKTDEQKRVKDIFLSKLNIILGNPSMLHSYGNQLTFNESSECN